MGKRNIFVSLSQPWASRLQFFLGNPPIRSLQNLCGSHYCGLVLVHAFPTNIEAGTWLCIHMGRDPRTKRWRLLKANSAGSTSAVWKVQWEMNTYLPNWRLHQRILKSPSIHSHSGRRINSLAPKTIFLRIFLRAISPEFWRKYLIFISN